MSPKDDNDISEGLINAIQLSSEADVDAEPVDNMHRGSEAAIEATHDQAVPDIGETETAKSEPIIPKLIVEKVDSKPSHGDDFGPNATVEQKDAHELRSKDAEADHVLVKPEATTLEDFDTAAAVADSIASLGPETVTPSSIDEEAGQDDLGRLSTTPIPEVASTAAEVADSAAVLDRDPPTTPIPEVANTAAEVAESAAILDKEDTVEEIASPLPSPTLPADDPRVAELVGITESESTPSGDLEQDLLADESTETMEPAQATVETVEPAREATKEEIAEEEIAEPELSSSATAVSDEPASTEQVEAATGAMNTDSRASIIRAIGAGDEGPQILIQPASPTVEEAEETCIPPPPPPFPKGADTAQSTSVEGKQSNGNGAMKMRNAAVPLERPQTSSSMGSPKKQESANFLTAFWQKFIVGWLGGLIMRLCGGRRQALLAVSALVLVILAPALYLSV